MAVGGYPSTPILFGVGVFQTSCIVNLVLLVQTAIDAYTRWRHTCRLNPERVEVPYQTCLYEAHAELMLKRRPTGGLAHATESWKATDLIFDCSRGQEPNRVYEDWPTDIVSRFHCKREEHQAQVWCRQKPGFLENRLARGCVQLVRLFSPSVHLTPDKDGGSSRAACCLVTYFPAVHISRRTCFDAESKR